MSVLEPKLEFINAMHEAAMVRHYAEAQLVAVDWHSHRELEMVYICEGDGNCMVGDRIVKYQAGDLIIVGPNVPHLFKSFDTASTDRRYIIQCSDKLFEGGMFELRDLEILRQYLEKLSYGVLISKQENEGLEAKIAELKAVSPHRAVLMFYLFLLELAEKDLGQTLSSLPYSTGKSETTRTGKILNFILENYATDLTVEGVASHMHMSKPAFCNYFKKAIGKRFSEFVNEVRINKACQMLRESDISVAEISYAVGYTNLSYFNRSFLKLKECSPKQYRQRDAA